PFTVPSPGVPLSADADPDVMTPAKPVADKPSEKVTAKEAKAAAEEVTQEISQSLEQAAPMAYQYPPVSLLKQESGVEGGQALGELKMNQDRLAEAIRSFGVDANIVNVVRGPSVTRYEMELDQGVKLSRVTNLADDIALALGAEAVRIAPIPDKISTVGIEVPNKLVSTVHIHDVIDSNAFTSSASKVSFAVGKDIGGNCIVGNIAKLPHLLIAGTTGSGKSVCTNSLIISLLYKATPEEVRLIMVDPKMVELGIYNGIPHLLIPVVTDPKKAAGALQWAVTEMMKRYRAFSEVGVRDLASYNAKAAKTEGMEKMPQVVVLIDELADLMLVAAKEVEESICRVAQMGRASGMHLVIATQRPSADVITGLMKANIPSRIAFAVSSSLESRIILDTTGAEKLVGKGDMLWFPLGAGKPHRVQGCFVSDEEVAAVVDFVKQSGSAEYDEAVMEEIDRNAQDKDKGAKGAGGAPGGDSSGEDFDELLPAAIEVVVEMGQASVSMLQRRLKLGYGRAARLVDQMEEKGVVGPFEGAKPRQVLVTKEQWQEMQYRQGLSPAPA
ncbi:MAG: DNA translocase FtsK, partial [Oscillospiraceae bacterium]